MVSEYEKMISGKLYNASNEDVEKRARRAQQLTRLFNKTTEEEVDYRKELINKLFKSTGSNVHINPPFRCDYGENISVGDNFYANFDCIILDVAEVIIGDNVMFAPRVGIYTASHPIDPSIRVDGLELGGKVTIGDNAWLCANVTINPNVNIGENTIIGSGSVVTKDIPPNVIAAGNPCKVIREITEDDYLYWNKLREEYYNEMD